MTVPVYAQIILFGMFLAGMFCCFAMLYYVIFQPQKPEDDLLDWNNIKSRLQKYFNPSDQI